MRDYVMNLSKKLGPSHHRLAPSEMQGKSHKYNCMLKFIRPSVQLGVVNDKLPSVSVPRLYDLSASLNSTQTE